MSESIYDTERETEYASVEDPLGMHRSTSKKTTLISDILKIINEENLIVAPGQGKIYLLPMGKFGYNSPYNISICTARYFNQILLNFIQYFASDEHCIFLPGLCMSSTTCFHQ